MLYADVLPPALTFSGKHQIHKDLGHYIAFHGITVSTYRHLLVAQFPSPAIHIYNMQGGYLSTISRTMLGLDEGLLVIWGIRCGSNGLLHVAIGECEKTGGQNIIRSLHAYRVGELGVWYRHSCNVMTLNVNDIYDISTLYRVSIKECISIITFTIIIPV